VELNSVEALLPVSLEAAFYLIKTKDFRLGLLMNFGDAHLNNGIRRITNKL
jgi:hypothetical protein